MRVSVVAEAARCHGCRVEIPPSRGGPARKWCSDRCRKETLYSVACRECGARVKYTGRRRDICAQCSDAHRDTYEGKVRHSASTRGTKGYTDDELRAALWSVAQDGRVTVHMYRAFYEGREGTMPTSQAFAYRHGSWSAAVKAYGLQPGIARRTYRRIPNEKLAADVAVVINALGKAPSVSEYNTFRRQHPELHLASDGIVRRYLGGWPEALALAGAA